VANAHAHVFHYIQHASLQAYEIQEVDGGWWMVREREGREKEETV
jgi:hypothetical protein